MKAPQSLSEENAFFRKLVAADNREEPKPEVLEDLLRKLPEAEPVPPRPARASSRIERWAMLAVLSSCILAGVTIFGGARTERTEPHPIAAPPSVAPTPAATNEAPSENPTPTMQVDDLPSARIPSARPEPPAPSGRREIELIILAREGLTRHEPDRCIAAVSAYEAEFPKGQFMLEAKAMRVEATAARGDRDRARALARDFLAKNPSSLYDERIRSLLASLEEQ